jgi:hypothetical protein
MNPDEIREKRLALFKDDPESDKQLPLMADEIRARGGLIKVQIYETGRVLTEAKALVGHGKFKEWIKGQDFDFGYQTASNFMRVYRVCLGRPDLVQTIPASILYQIASPGFPKDLREFLFENADGLETIKSQKIRDICKRVKKKELTLTSPEVKGLVKFNRENNQSQAYEAELDNVFAKLESLEKTIVKLSSGITWPTFPGKDRTELTGDQERRVDALTADMVRHIENLKPDFKQVKRIHPRLVVSGE